MSITPIETKRRLEASEFQVAWVSALEIEYSAARALLDEEFQSLPRKAGDPNVYALGRIGSHNVVIARLPEGIIGNNAAATVAANLSTSFPSAKIGLMVGIGGGVPSDDHDIRLGDVVVSKPSNEEGGVVQYDLGKATTGGQFQRIGHMNKPQPLLLHALGEVKSNHTLRKGTYSTHLATLQKISAFTRPKAEPDRLFKSTYFHQQGSTCAGCDAQMLVNRVDRSEEVQFYYGTIASGNQVMKDAEKRDRISLKLRGILCFEMEAAGLDNLNCLVIRGICDYADSHKDDKWQPYAAATAAAYAKEILLVIPPEEVKNAPPMQEAPFMVPFRRNELFTGRDTILRELKDALSQSLGCPYRTIHGLGGCGKSAVALEFLYQVRDQHPYRSIFWVPAISAIEFEAAYRKIAQLLQLPGATDPNTNVLKVVKEALSRDDAGSWLMVVDNADDLDVFQTEAGSEKQTSRLKDSLPNSSLGMIVFTSRSRKTADSLSRGGLIPLDRMTTDEARNCLCQILQKPELFQDDKAASELLEALSFLPLAIIQAAAYMVQNNTTVQEYLGLYEKTDQAKIWALCKEFDDDRRYKTSNNAVAITWHISFQKIREDDATAASYLAFMACIAPEKIPLSDFFPDSQGFEGKEAIGTLDSYGFITRERDSGLYDMHQLVHLATRNWLDQEGQWSTWIGKVLDRLLEMIPNGGLKGREQYAPYLPHGIYAFHLSISGQQGKAVLLLERIGRCQRDLGEYRKAGTSWNLILESRERILGPKDPATLFAMHEVGFFLNLQGNYEEAESLHKKTLALKEEVLGKEHESTISSMHNLAQVLSNQGRYVPAEEMYKKTLDLAKQVSGPSTRLTLATTANLAGVLDKQGRYLEAEKLHEEAVQLKEKVLGKDDRETLSSMSNLANNYRNQGRWNDAKKLEVQVMETRKRVLGPEHPDTLTSQANLASTYRNQGRWNDAKKLEVQVMETSLRVLGPEHPSTLTSQANLASTLWNQGRWNDAKKLEVQVMETSLRVLGPEHPSTLTSQANLASTYRNQGRWNDAKKLEVQVMETRKRVLGPEHPDTLTSQANLASTYRNQGRWNDAEKLDVQVMETSLRVLGAEHPDTLTSQGNLASTYRNQGRWNDAENLEVQVMETSLRVLGPEHPSTLTSQANLASTYRNQGRWNDAKKLEVQVMETRKRVLGPEHPDTLTSQANLASTYRNQGRWNDAEKLDVQVMETGLRVLGPEHPSTLTSQANLASTYRNQGRWNDAEKLEVQVMETSLRVLGAEHPDTLTSQANLASTYRNQGRWNDAEKLDVQVMETRKRVLGAEHPSTLTSQANLASTLWNQGRWNDAEKLDVQVMETSLRVLGAEHPDTLTSQANLASTLWNQGRWNDAEKLEVQVMETRKRVLGPEHPSTLTSQANLASTYQNQGRWNDAEKLEVQVMETRKRVLGPEHPDTLTSMNNLAHTLKGHGRDDEAISLLTSCWKGMRQTLGPSHPNTQTVTQTLFIWLHAAGIIGQDNKEDVKRMPGAWVEDGP